MNTHCLKRRAVLRMAAAGTALAGAPALFMSTAARAADAFPSRPLRVVIPFTAGGGTDVVGRVLGQALAAELGQPVIIDNRAGAGTVIGSDIVSKAPATATRCS